MQDNKVMMDWLHRRKISDTVISEFGIHWGENPIMGECIVIPVKNEEGIFSFNKYRRSPLSEDLPKYTYDKGSHMSLYGAHKIKDVDKVLITEGELDALVAWSANIPAVSSTGGALSFQRDWVDMFKDKEVIVCFDADQAGGDGMAKIFDMMPWAKLVFIPTNLPHVKDVSDFVASGGDLEALLSTAKGYDSLADVIKDRSERSATWQNIFFHNSYVHNHMKPTYAPKVKGDRKNVGSEVMRAKEYPIHEIINFNMQGKTTCLWHNEKEPSLNYYPKDNKVWCFGGCGRGYDSIDVYMKVNGVGFKEAIKKMQ